MAVSTLFVTSASLLSAAPLANAAPTGGTVPGWPSYIAMGAIAGPNITPPTATSTGGNDDFGGRPIDVGFKYAGVNGNGDPGVIDPPTNAYRMTSDYNALSPINKHPMRGAIVEYTAQMSGGQNFSDFSNDAPAYMMGRHFAGLAADAQMLATNPVMYKDTPYYGSLIMNPDLLGAIQQNNYIDAVNAALPAGAVNTAVAQAMCLLTTSRSYTNKSNPNGLPNPPYLGKTYHGTPVQILQQLLGDGYPVWSIDGQSDAFWNTNFENFDPMGNQYSQVGAWFNECVTHPAYNKAQYSAPNFPAGFNGWVQANNWLIRTMAPKNTVTLGWQDNMRAIGSGFWLHKNLTDAEIASTYSVPVLSWLTNYAGSTISRTVPNAPDFFVFDRYEMDDSAAPGSATLYNARSWDNYLTAIGTISKASKNMPIMLWQIPGSHIPYVGEPNPELFQGKAGSYIFSTAPIYFFGDNNLSSDLGNIIMGTSTQDPNVGVGNYLVACGPTAYNCLTATANYQQYLLEYQDRPNNYNWGSDNGRLKFTAENNVFSILWGGGNTTNVIKNFSNPDDHGWLAHKLIEYYAKPTPVVHHAAR
jgi:hypothetical protein